MGSRVHPSPRPRFRDWWVYLAGNVAICRALPPADHERRLLARAAERAVEPLTVADMVGGGTIFGIRKPSTDAELGELLGAFVLELVPERDGLAINCTAAAAAPGTDAGVVAAVLAFGQAEADRLGAVRLTFSTIRPGLAKLMQRQGFEPRPAHEYCKELAHGKP